MKSKGNLFKCFSIPLFMLIGLNLIAQNTQSYIDPETSINMVPNLQLDDSYILEFSDEFNDSIIDDNKWQINVSSSSRAAREKLSIDDWWWVKENAFEENGNLVLRVTKHDENTMYCGSINANNRYEKAFGYYETRIKIADASKGTHTAFWFQGDRMGNIDGTGNDGAEVDVFESAWLGDYTKSVVHIDGYGSAKKANTVQYNTLAIHEGYHIWGLLWTEDFLKIYYDGDLKVTYQGIWVPKEPEYMWLSDGASFGIEGDYFTSQPNGTLTEAYVDYVRVWRIQESPVKVEVTDTVSFEAENLNIQGNSRIENCGSASAGSLVNLLGSGGVDNDSFDVKTGGAYNLIITYLTSGDREAALYVNNELIDTLTFPSSGPWCFAGGGTAELVVPVDLIQTGNQFAIRPIGVNGPHIDKVTAARKYDLTEVGLSVSNTTLEEGGSIEINVETAQPLGQNQNVSLKLSGLDESDYVFSDTDITIMKGASSASTTLTILDDYEITGDRSITISIDSYSSLLLLGNATAVTLNVLENDEPIGVSLTADVSEVDEGSQILLTVVASTEVPNDQVVKLQIKAREGSFEVDEFVTILAGKNTAETVLKLIDNEEPKDNQTIEISIESTSTLLVAGEGVVLTVLDNEITLEVGNESFSIYPNPVSNKLLIQSIRSIDKVTLYDLSGKPVLILDNIEKELDLSGLKSGVYILELEVLGETYRKRIIKN